MRERGKRTFSKIVRQSDVKVSLSVLLMEEKRLNLSETMGGRSGCVFFVCFLVVYVHTQGNEKSYSVLMNVDDLMMIRKVSWAQSYIYQS